MRKGQEEIVGFVVIVVIVSVLALVFLGISLRKGEVSYLESAEVYQFLESSMEYTSECAVRFENDYRRLGSLFEECYSGSECFNGKSACEVAEENVKKILPVLKRGDNSIKGYRFNAFYVSNSNEEKILSVEDGNCTAGIKGASYLAPAFPGKIRSVLEVCD